MSGMETTKRYILLVLGLFINAFGISFITKASLGTSPISSIPYVLSLRFEPTLGMFTFAFNLILIAGQILMLRSRFRKIQLLQIPVTLAFSYFIDVTMTMLSFVQPDFYLVKAGFLLLGCGILAFGVFTEVTADVVMLPGEAFVKALANTIGKEFGTVKVCFDTTLMICSLGLSLLFFRQLSGVREGTVVSALIVGLIVRFYQKRLRFLTAAIFPHQLQAQPEREAAEAGAGKAIERSRVIVTISRQYGSGGREIGEKLAKRLGVPFFDRAIIDMAAEDSGYSREYIEKNEQKVSSRILYDLVAADYAFAPGERTPQEALFAAEGRVIQKVAEQGSCVIVGRCADYILRDRTDCLNVYICASTETRVRRLMETEYLSEKNAQMEIARTDRARSEHYRRFTGQSWGASENYDLTIDSDLFGVEGTVSVVAHAVGEWKGGRAWAI